MNQRATVRRTNAAGVGRVGQAVAAGIVGGAVLDGFLTLAGQAPYPAAYQFIASGIVGAAAYTGTAFAGMGLALHFVISIFWALLYTFAAGQMRVLRTWLASGAVLGAAVWAGMQGVEVYTHLAAARWPAGPAMAGGIGVHIVFYGWPVAWWMRKG